MAVNVIFFTGRGGSGGRYLRHILRALEMLSGGGKNERAAALDNGQRFWTRNLPLWVLREDPRADEIAAHAYDWQSDIGLAEESLLEALKRRQIVPVDGRRPQLRSNKERAWERLLPRPTRYDEKLDIEKQAISLRAYVEMRDMEEQARGLIGRGKLRTGFGVIISFDVALSNAAIKTLVDRFLAADPFESHEESAFKEKPVEVFSEHNRPPFRDCGMVAALHREGNWTHVHLWIDVRDIHGQVIKIHPKVWKALGLRWARIWSDYTGDEQQLIEYEEKTGETAEWRRETYKRIELGLAPNPQPARVAHDYDQRALKIASQNKVHLQVVGLDSKQFYFADRIGGPRSNDELRRVMAAAKVAEEELARAYAIGKPLEELVELEARARTERLHLDAIETAREVTKVRRRTSAEREAKKQTSIKGRGASSKKKQDFQFYMTDKQQGKFDHLRQERLEDAKDDRRTALLMGHQTIIKSDLKAAREDGERFETARWLMPLFVKGKEWTLLEVEIATADRIESRRATQPKVKLKSDGQNIRSEINERELEEVREVLEAYLARQEERIRQRVEMAEWRHHLIGDVVSEASEVRAGLGKPMPSPLYLVEEREKVMEVADRHQDQKLARQVHRSFRSSTLKPEHARETAAAEVGQMYRSLMNKLEKELLYGRARVERSATRPEGAAKASRRSGARKTGIHKKSGLSLGKQQGLRLEALDRYASNKTAQAISLKLLSEREADYVSAKDYLLARQQIASDCLEAADLKKEEIVPQLTMSDEWRMENLIRELPRGKDRRELQDVLTRLREARLVRSRSGEYLRAVAVLYGALITEEIKQEAAHFRKQQYEKQSSFEEWITTGRSGVEQTWSLAGIRHAIRTAPDQIVGDLPECAQAIEMAIEERRSSYDEEIDSSTERVQGLSDEFSKMAAVLEMNLLQLPPPTFTYEQEREIELTYAETRNSQAIQEFCRLEAEKDLPRAAGRSLARLIVSTVAVIVEGQTHQEREEQLGSLREATGQVIQSDQAVDLEYAQEIDNYLDFLHDEQTALTGYREALSEVSQSLTRVFQALPGGESSRAIFMPQEYAFLEQHLWSLPAEMQESIIPSIGEPHLETYNPESLEPSFEIISIRRNMSSMERYAPQTFHIQPDNSQMNAGRLIGDYLEEALRVQLNVRPGLKADTSRLTLLDENVQLARSEHQRLYGGHPRAILTGEQNEFLLANRDQITKGYTTDFIDGYMQDAIVEGQSSPDQSLERSLELEKIFDLIL
jgi:hypothetical protein